MAELFELQVEPRWSGVCSFGEHQWKALLEDFHGAPFLCDFSHAEEKMSLRNSSGVIHIS